MADADAPYDWLIPDWPAPANVHAFSTSRNGGVSGAPFDTLNLGDHVGDVPERVEQNRSILARELSLPAAPVWLKQVHGTRVVDITLDTGEAPLEADAAYSSAGGRVCVVMTADCLPLLLCDRNGSQVAAVHAGWRGLAAGVIEAAVARFSCAPENVMAWLGPAIGPQAFEVGEEVRDAFVDRDPAAAAAFQPSAAGRLLTDIYKLARLRLKSLGVEAVYGGGRCTYSESGYFHSYRRDGDSGRMATLIWLD